MAITFLYPDPSNTPWRRFSSVIRLTFIFVFLCAASKANEVLDSAAWPENIIDPSTAPVDLSFLNGPEKPAGKHGFLRAVNGRLEFEDGTPARFWGTNLVAFSLFSTPHHDDVERQAMRLSALGFNLVRLHHHDSEWVVPNIFGRNATNSQQLDEASLERLDWWIKCLEDQGIYIWLDLHVGRQLKAADQIDDFAEISKGRRTADLKGYAYVNASIQTAMERFDEAYLDHVNRFTGLRYKDDPGIVTLLITNENDVTNHFGNLLLPNRNVPHETSLYMTLAASFAEKHNLPVDKTWRSWEQGPSKLFLNDLEHNFNRKMIEYLRRMGVRVPIVTTNTWGKNPLSSLPSLTDGDIIDVHSYGGVGELEKDPNRAANLIDWIAAAHLLGWPLSVSEWNVAPFPIPDRHTVPLYVASEADLQGWDEMLQFAYSQVPLDPRGRLDSRDNWETFRDPGMIATLPAAALLYRRHDVEEAHTTYVFAPSSEQLFDELISPDHAVALRTAVELGKLMIALPRVPELPWLKPSHIPPDAKVVTDLQQSLLANNATEAVSDTGQLTRNWQQGIYKIDSPRTQAVMGWLGGKMIDLSDVQLRITTPNATVAVQSLDDSPIKSSSNLMISLGARSTPDVADHVTFRSEPVGGRLTIRAKAGLKLYRRGGTRQVEIPISYTEGRYQIDLGPALATHWLFMK
jgi:hypothetical protein